MHASCIYCSEYSCATLSLYFPKYTCTQPYIVFAHSVAITIVPVVLSIYMLLISGHSSIE